MPVVVPIDLGAGISKLCFMGIQSHSETDLKIVNADARFTKGLNRDPSSVGRIQFKLTTATPKELPKKISDIYACETPKNTT